MAAGMKPYWFGTIVLVVVLLFGSFGYADRPGDEWLPK